MDEGSTVHGPPKLWLMVVADGQPQNVSEVGAAPFVIGRDAECDLTLDDPKVSRRHAVLTASAGPGRTISDLGSSNGTLVDGRPMTAAPGFGSSADRRAEIYGGEILQFGDTIVVAALVDPRLQEGFPRLAEGTQPDA